jgi:GT2 family glycosyltransferase
LADLTAITVTYGSSESLDRTCGSLSRTTRDGSVHAIHHVIVTQPDETGERATVPSSASEIRVDENLGFAGANNLAVAETSSEYLAFLNPDLELTEGWLDPLIEALSDPAVAIAAPVLLNDWGDVDEAGQAVFSDGGTLAIGGAHWPRFPNSYPSVMFDRDIDYASAACWVMRRSMFDELGGFSSAYYPAYFEDADFGQRVQQAGYVTRLITARPVVHHHEGASAERVAIAERSRKVFEDKWGAQLAAKPDRSLLETNPTAVRDHLCKETTVERISRDAIETLATKSASDPRNRYIAFVTDTSETELHLLRRTHSPSGLEIRSSTQLA